MPAEDLLQLTQYVDQLAASVKSTTEPMGVLSTHYGRLQQIHALIKAELSKLPLLEPPAIDLDSQFLAHSRITHIQSVQALQEVTDAMEVE